PCAPPKNCADTRAVDNGPFEVDGARFPKLRKKQVVQCRPDRQLGPFRKSTPASTATATAHLDRQELPRNARLQYEHYARERLPIGHPRPPAQRRRLWFRRQ